MSAKKKKDAESEEVEALTLSGLSPLPGSRRRRKRVGCGGGSGKGKTCGKGHKGAKCRSGYRRLAGFEGGQMPIFRRLPKRGFNSRKKVLGKNVFSLVPVSRLEELAKDGEITLETLRSAGLVRSVNDRVKLVSGTEVGGKVVVEAHAATRSAREAIEKSGGEIKIVQYRSSAGN